MAQDRVVQPAAWNFGLRRVLAAPRARLLLILMWVALGVRLATLGIYPLADTSEARYGEIARVMRLTGNWVTPQETPGTPFWAKPPLSTWLSAASTYVFGMDEFALRLPSFLCGLGVVLLCAQWSAALARRPAPPPPGSPRAPATPDRPSPADAGLWASVILSTTILFFVGYGAVMTDPPLGLCTAWMMVAFHQAVIEGSAKLLWRYGFFVAAGLAMLAKGPVAFLYVLLPVALWTLARGRWRRVAGSLPWVRGALLAAAISLPWYGLAEARTPGFLNYFLVGEHLMRYLHPGWSGDRYGNAHSEPLGTIWAYLAGALGIWSAPALVLVRPGSGWFARAAAFCGDEARLFALLAALVPLLAFTFAGNLIWTYVMPPLTPLVALLGVQLAQRTAADARWRRGALAAACAAATLVAAGSIFWAPLRANGSSFAAPVQAWHAQQAARPGPLLYWGHKVPASLRFYSRAAAEAAPDLPQRLDALAAGATVYVAAVPEQLPALRQLASRPERPLRLDMVAQVKHAVIVQIGRPG